MSKQIMSIHLVKCPVAQVVAAAKPYEMDGWASSAAKDHGDPNTPMFAIENEKREIIGQAGLKIWPPGSARVTATIAIFNPKYRGKGIGTLAIRMLLAHAFRELGLRRVTVAVDKGNIAAQRCYRKAGFATAKVDKDGRIRMEALGERWLETRPVDIET